MNLDELKKLESEASQFECAADSADRASKVLQHFRTSDRKLDADGFRTIINDWRYGHSEMARDELFAAFNEAKEDLVRLVELRLAARVRDLRIKGAQRRAVLNASILPVPGAEKPTEAA